METNEEKLQRMQLEKLEREQKALAGTWDIAKTVLIVFCVIVGLFILIAGFSIIRAAMNG